MADLKTDYLIIGNSAAGVTAAETLRAHDADASIVMVSKEPYPAYGRPLISYLIEGKTSEDRLWLKPDDFYERNGITTCFGPHCEAVELDAADHTVRLLDGRMISYGKCLLATGSVPFTPPIQGMDALPAVYGFMTLDDAQAVRAAVEEAAEAARSTGRETRVLVIGAGLIGLKAAEALSGLVDEVLVLELAPRILPAVLDEAGAAVLKKSLEAHGIVCRPGVSVEEFLGRNEAGRIDVRLTDGSAAVCDVVVAAVGVRPASQLAVEAGAEQGRGLVCDDSLMTTLPDVYAAGDVVQMTDRFDGSLHPLALWPNAMRQGREAALHMCGACEAEPVRDAFAVNAVDFFEASLLTAGMINPKEDDRCEIRTISDEDAYAKFVIRDNNLVGYILLNRPNGAGIYTSIIEQATPLDTLDASIFEGTPVNLDFPESARWERLHKMYPRQLDARGWKQEA